MKKAVICIYALLFLAIFNCEKNKDIIKPERPTNQILLYSSFEKDGQPGNNGWLIKDESSENYSTDVPPGGGNYSLSLRGDSLNLLGEWARIILPAIDGNNIYRFSFWCKQQGACGIVHIYVKTSDTSGYYTKSKLACDSLWSYYTIVDTIQTNENDSLMLLIGSEHAWVPDGKAYFDLCKLEKLN